MRGLETVHVPTVPLLQNASDIHLDPCLALCSPGESHPLSCCERYLQFDNIGCSSEALNRQASYTS